MNEPSPPQENAPQTASFLLRFYAFVIDGLIHVGFLLLCYLFTYVLFILITSEDGGPLVRFISLLSLFFFNWLYSAISESSSIQGTLGKKFSNIRITTIHGERIGFIRASIRYFLKYISAITVIGYLFVGFTPRKQALHDYGARTIVVHSTSQKPVHSQTESMIKPECEPESTEFAMRFQTYIVDNLILLGGNLLLFILLFWSIKLFVEENSVTDPTLVISLITLFVFNWFYYAFTESSSKQATVGKNFFDTHVTDLQYRRISFTRASVRYFMKYFSFFTIVGYLLAGFTKRNQALHDIVAGTIVVYDTHPQPPASHEATETPSVDHSNEKNEQKPSPSGG